MKKAERIITVLMLIVISLSNIATPVSYAAQNAVAKLPPPASNKIAPPAGPPSFHQPDKGSVLGASTSLLTIGTQSSDETEGTLGSAGKRIPIRMQQLAKKVYQTDEDVLLAVTNPDNDPFSTAVVNTKGQDVNIPITESNDGTTTNVQISGSNEITPGTYTIKVTDESGDVTTQDFSWGVLALNTDKSMYHPGETAAISLGVLDDNGNMVCAAQLTLNIKNQAGGSTDILSTQGQGKNQIIVNPQCQQHGFSLQPDYQAQYTFNKVGTYTFQLTATTSSGSHSITDIIPVTNDIPFDVQRVSATRIYPPNTYPMTFNIKANRDFNGTVTETVPEDFVITPATESATSVNSYNNMQTVYLNSNDPAAQLQQAITASSSGGLTMPFKGNYPITQGFGAQLTDPTLQAFYTQYGLAGHDGVDFGVPMDTPLYAVDDGNILQAGPGDYGTTIIIQHGWGESYYGHLSTTAVAVGAHVTKGELIGYSGESGEATGPHLHFGMRPLNPDMTNGYYGKVDPMPYLPYNQTPQPISSLGPSIALPTPASVLSASTSADSSDASESAAISPSPTVTPTEPPAVSPSASPSAAVSQSPTSIPSPTVETQATTTITQSSTPPANTAISVLDKQILLDEQIANSSETEKVKVITWHVTLKKGDTTSLGYDFQAPPQSPQFYLLGPMQFYQSGSNRVVFQEQRQWQIASDDVGVSWYTNTTPNTWNGYSWQYRKKLDINSAQVSNAPSVPTVDFMEAGGQATNATTGNTNFKTSTGGFYSTTSGTVAYDTTTTPENGPGSIKITENASNSSQVEAPVLNDSGRRISFYVNISQLPSSTTDIMELDTTGFIDVMTVSITSGGVLEVQSFSGGTVIGTGATLSTNTWYRIDLSYNITSASHYSLAVYVNGTSSISHSQTSGGTQLGGGTVGTNMLFLGWGSTGTVGVMNIEDVYVDSGTDVSDPGNVLVTAKRPFSNGTTNNFAGSGTPTGYPVGATGNAQYVSERPLNTGAIVSENVTAKQTEEYNIESISSGDVNLTGQTILSTEGWIYAKEATTSNSPVSDIIVNGTPTSVTLSTTVKMYTDITMSSSYPSGAGADIGMDGQYTTTAGIYTLDEAGVQVAYIPSSGGSQSNFPVLINLSSDNDLKNHAQNLGNDILFTDSTGENLLPFEIESYNASTGSLQAWVKIASLSTTADTIIYMYFGNPAASYQGSTGTWNSNYGAVWHLAATSGTTVNDSTANAYNATSINTITGITGQIDGGQKFNGSTDFDKKSNVSGLDTISSVTVSAWVNTGTATEQVFNAGDGSTNGYELYINGSDICLWAGSSLCSTTSAATNGWEFIAGTISAGSANIYASGSAVKNGSLTITNPTLDNQIGAKCTATGSTTCSSFFNGQLDEVEVSNTVLTPGWILTEYNNESSPSTFYTLGSLENSNYAPALSQVLRHGEFFGTVGTQSGVRQPFTW